MDIKKITEVIRYILGAVVGRYVFSSVFICVFLAPLVYDYSSLTYENLSPYQWLYPILSVLIWVIGGVGGLYSTYRRNILYEIFRFKKYNVIPNILIYVVLLTYAFVTHWVFWYENMWSNVGRLKFVFISVPWNFALSIFYFHPFIALVHWSIVSIRHRRWKLLWLWILLAVILNPVILMSAGMLDKHIEFQMYHQLCGTKVEMVSEGLPAHQAGMEAGEMIYELGGVQIESPEDVVQFMRSLNTQREISIVTDRGPYRILPEWDSEQNQFVMGIIPVNAYCRD
ncbi:MAG: hypothetical protein K8I00_00440 [Candidatus Omnitrophica bacterium]|nr:hypothetical protein [Candidatus Omnitrophota bacterium]